MGIQKGDDVKWSYGGNTASGKVAETFNSKTTRKIDGSEITRNGSNDNKALLIKQEDNQRVLKLESEVQKK